MRPFITVCFLPAIIASGGCGMGGQGGTMDRGVSWESKRLSMVTNQIEARGVTDPMLLEAFRKVPRHDFVPERYRESSYGDHPLPIGSDQTISQPYIVAFMTDLLQVGRESKVLEIGTGSGYQAAILGELAGQVYTIEIVPVLHEGAKKVLGALGYRNIHLKLGDGYLGWPEEAPFDAIIVTAAPNHIPRPLKEQLALGGRLVIPVGDAYQELIVVERTVEGLRETRSLPVRFVPMTGIARDEGSGIRKKPSETK